LTLLWELEQAGTLYSVRGHGASVRLYSNGVFHSQWNPERPFAGGIWDCLGLPVLYRRRQATRRILVLGVGGGAVIRQLEMLVPFESLTALEIDPVHVDVARRWFGVNDARVSLFEADAIAWVQHYTGEPFDLVIDDLFGHASGQPVRARALTPEWVALLRGITTRDGLTVVNCVESDELSNAAWAFLDGGYRHARRWSLPGYDNAIGVFSGDDLVPRDWSRRLDASGLATPMQRQARAIVRRPLRTERRLAG